MWSRRWKSNKLSGATSRTHDSCFLLRTCRSQDVLQPTGEDLVKKARQRDMAELAGMLGQGQGQGQGGWQQLSRQEQDELARWAPGWCKTKTTTISGGCLKKGSSSVASHYRCPCQGVVQASTAGSMRDAQVSGLACALCCKCNRCCSGARMHCHPDKTLKINPKP